MIQQSSERVIGIIVDDSRNASPPPNVLSAFQRIFRHGRLPMAIIGGHHLTKLLVNVVESSTQPKRRIFRVSTVEEARQVLQQSMEETTGGDV